MRSEGDTDTARIIDGINCPADLKALDDEQLAIVAHEIRDQIVKTTSVTGGHLAPSLGAVEMIVALHAELNCPPDRIVFDVGHQAYAHKILTGRLSRFDTLRQEGGLSGFPNPFESDYDVHPSGHASDSISVALGLAKARDIRGGNEHIVAVIGDASISGGMALEAINHIGQEHRRTMIVLNDNGMSIAPNVGALARHFERFRASDIYRAPTEFVRHYMDSKVVLRKALGIVDTAKGSVKQLFLPEFATVFEQLGITCFAPVDGHDIPALRKCLHNALRFDGPTLVHVITNKGQGYGPAERTPELFHGVGPFDAATGKLKSSKAGLTFTDVFGATLLEQAREDDRIVAITAGMEGGTGLTSFAQEFPNRFVDVGISEEHAVGFAGGLATGGCKPVVAIYSTFLQRGIDQMMVDVALAKQDVVICIDRAGLVGEDGATHQGAFDLVFTRMVPNMRVLAPSDGLELERALRTSLTMGGPFAIRYPKGSCGLLSEEQDSGVLEEGVSRTLAEGDDIALLAVGSMVAPALGAAKILAKEDVSARVVDMRWVKPLDEHAVLDAAQTGLVVTIEEGVLSGGVGEEVLAVLARKDMHVPTLAIGLPDEFVSHGKREVLLSELGLDAEGIAASVRKRLAELKG